LCRDQEYEEHYVYSPILPQGPDLPLRDKYAATIFRILEVYELRTSSYFNFEKFPFVIISFDSTQFYNSVVSDHAAGDIIRNLFTTFDRNPLLNP